MSPSALSSALLAVAAITFVHAQPDPADPTPLVDKHYAYPSGISTIIPHALRGPQTGYNICNSTTENQNSLCQTSFVNHIDDFCLWAPPQPNSTIGDTEVQDTVLVSSPPVLFQGVQLIKTPNYIQIAGFIDQTQVNIAANDYGGELDPHGADLRGNPLGGLMYSNAFPSNGGNNDSYQQVIDWTNFMGGDGFCMKVCDPAGQNQQALCQNIYDRLGCAYNAPNNAQKGVFEVCDGDDMSPVGVYTTNGATSTYFQPAESLGPITTVPYTATPAPSSNCVTYASTALYTGQPTPSGATASSGASGAKSTASGTNSGASPAKTGGAATMGVSLSAGLVGCGVRNGVLS
ncbi:uncharacterized protein F5891DRAFT_1255642 [Suillus fuscotomentosus]|uniref:Macrofage activating glycoprotein n=1 Tax=Suillus fuscotomentosus TaxID=1912939 RepID=A0AAD4HQD0_9AGAM|nr:uncharacterized protein F5891DRAFT_1255642 [Suillus fuscotomentosus]KAG1905128.1 hypothetical protein F5891DRAFT_1255642 [Suillus fuscotomentosus]